MRTRIASLTTALILTAAGAAPGQPPPDPRVEKFLARVSEEAEVFRATAPKMLARETLVQRTLIKAAPSGPPNSDAGQQTPKPEYRTREVVSEYTFSSFRDSPNALREFRQVLSVDGKQVASQQKARRRLLSGLQSGDDQARQRLLEDFEKNGLSGAATDFGQVLILFVRRKLPEYSFKRTGARRVGTTHCTVLEFRQRAGAGSLLILEKRKALHQALEGEIWVRTVDGVPLGVVLRTSRKSGDQVLSDEATVEYDMTPNGSVAPTTVTHRGYADKVLVVENVYHYSPFRLFEADTKIQY